ncbi:MULTISPECIES: VOC family protein [unclassified Nitrobacter]|uniref:VOC family protein n=1 Tax=unclassified Nitrobacter TaxID=2620411 RepID=UPI000A4FAF12|nr:MULTISPECIES: VOC family protein [unclassified Nitrobacter]
MLALDSQNAKADAALFAHEGIGRFEPFFFERKARRPDGSETHVAFTLAFASSDNAPECGFFVCQQHLPEHFWNPEFQSHHNGALNIAAVGMTAGYPEMYQKFLAAFCGSKAARDPDANLSIKLCSGRLKILADATREPELRLNSITITLPDVNLQAQLLNDTGVHFQIAKNALIVPREEAFGLDLRFEHDVAFP